MERIKEALEKARQERQIRQGDDTAAPQGTPRQDAGETGASQTQTITVDDALLRENRIVTGFEPCPFTDAYKMLRTQVLQRLNENNWNVLAVTSPGTGEGKTLTALNLAVSLAMEVDYTVLLVDANLRHPSMHEHLGLAHRKGLSDYLTEDTPLSESIDQSQRHRPPDDTAGRAAMLNSAEMLNSPKMAQLVEEMKTRYPSRIVIFDLPPVLDAADAMAFAPYVDATLLVVEEGKTRKRKLNALWTCSSAPTYWERY